MRTGLILLLGCTALLPATLVAEDLTVAALESKIQTMQARHNKDGSIADHLILLKLTERLTWDRKLELSKMLPGAKSRRSLQLLQDASEFLAPPAEELPKTPAPTIADQRKLLGATQLLVGEQFQHMPNFFATRQLARYRIEEASIKNFYVPIVLEDSLSIDITVREGKETDQLAGMDKKMADLLNSGPYSSGEFSTMLPILFSAHMATSFQWSRWEKQEGKVLGVFHYAVDRSHSQTNAEYCCVADAHGGSKHYLDHPAYHGELWIDPDTSEVLRMTSMNEEMPDSPVKEWRAMVEYGKVKVGELQYLLPIRSVSLVERKIMDQFYTPIDAKAVTVLMSESSFLNYHRFRAAIRFPDELPEDGKTTPAAPSAAPPTLPK